MRRFRLALLAASAAFAATPALVMAQGDDHHDHGGHGGGDHGGDHGGGGNHGGGDHGAHPGAAAPAAPQAGRQDGDRHGGDRADGAHGDDHRGNPPPNFGGADRGRPGGDPGRDGDHRGAPGFGPGAHGGQGGYRGPLPDRPDHGGRYDRGGQGGYHGGFSDRGRDDWRGYRDAHRDLFRAGRYSPPRGYAYGYRRFARGYRLPAFFYARSYWIDDPYAYRLTPAEGPYRWVRYYDDVLLVDLRSGTVVDAIEGFFL